MNIALCFSGLPRWIEYTYDDYYNNLIKPNNITDIFIHTWKLNVGENVGHRNFYKSYEPDIIKDTLDKYKPLILLEESNQIIKEDEDYHEDIPNPICQNGLFNVLSMFYSMNKVNEIKETYRKQNNINYDVVIRARFDLVVAAPIIIDKIEPSTLYTPDFYGNPQNKEVSDIFAYGDENTMNIYNTIWKKYYDLYKTGMPFRVENLFFKHMTNHGIQNIINNIIFCKQLKIMRDKNVFTG